MATWACTRGAVQLREGMEGSLALNPQKPGFTAENSFSPTSPAITLRQSHGPPDAEQRKWPSQRHTHQGSSEETQNKSQTKLSSCLSRPPLEAHLPLEPPAYPPRGDAASSGHSMLPTTMARAGPELPAGTAELRALQHSELQASNAEEREALLRCADPGRQQEAGGGRGGEH